MICKITEEVQRRPSLQRCIQMASKWFATNMTFVASGYMQTLIRVQKGLEFFVCNNPPTNSIHARGLALP